MKRSGLLALLAAALSGCPSVGVTSAGSILKRSAAFPSSGLIGGNVEGSKDLGAPSNGQTTAIFQTAIGPIAWKGLVLARLSSAGPIALWTAPSERYSSAIAIASESLGWAVGRGVTRYDRATGWTEEPTDIESTFSLTAPQAQRVTLTDVAFASGSATVGYAVGTKGTILKYSSSLKQWLQETTLPVEASGKNFGTVKVLSSSDVWVAGEVVLHFANGTWTKTSLPTGVQGVSGLSVVAPDNIWASTGSGLMQWNGSSWTMRFSTARSVGSPQLVASGSTLVGLSVEPGVPGGSLYTLSADGKSWETSSIPLPEEIGLDTLVLVDDRTAYAKTYDNSGLWTYDLKFRQWNRYSD